MLRVGATGSAFYYFRDFSAVKMPRAFVHSVGSMIDRQRERGRSRRGGSIHIQSLPAASDICGDVYICKKARSDWHDPAADLSHRVSFHDMLAKRHIAPP